MMTSYDFERVMFRKADRELCELGIRRIKYERTLRPGTKRKACKKHRTSTLDSVNANELSEITATPVRPMVRRGYSVSDIPLHCGSQHSHRHRMNSLDSAMMKSADTAYDDTLSNPQGYTGPEVGFPLVNPKLKSKPKVVANVSHLTRRRSLYMTLHGVESTKQPLSALMERLFLAGSKSTDKMAETRRLSMTDDVITHLSNHRLMERRRAKLVLLRIQGKKRLYLKFRTVARMAIFCIRLSTDHCLSSKDEDELSPFLKSLNFHDYSTLAGVDLLFDPSKFKANKQTRIQGDIRRIFSKPPIERSKQDLYTVHIAMRNIKCFQGYPARMQRLLAEVGTYQRLHRFTRALRSAL